MAKPLHERRGVITALALTLLAISVVAAWDGTSYVSTLKTWAGNTIPEFLGAVVIALILGSYFRMDATRRYIAAMRAVREAVMAQNLPAHSTQGLIKEVVPAISRLHFGTKAPDRVGTFRREVCATCRSSECELVAHGKCSTCGDLAECWRG
jgi:hypothetical protein